jgi:hypothetical protein
MIHVTEEGRLEDINRIGVRRAVTASARVALGGVLMGPQREVEERVKQTEEGNERVANARRGRRDVLERSQLVQGTRARKTVRKQNNREV